MRVKELLNSPLGRIFISILLGLGLATFFREVCEEKNCLRFRGPILSEVDGKIYKHGDKCYRYDTHSSGKCDADPQRKVVEVSTDKPDPDKDAAAGLKL
jgi:hypothetical protein